MIAPIFPAAAATLINRISRSTVSHLTNGTVGGGMASGEGLAEATSDGLSAGEAPGDASAWLAGLGVRAAADGDAPGTQAAKTVTRNAMRRLECLMNCERGGLGNCYALP